MIRRRPWAKTRRPNKSRRRFLKTSLSIVATGPGLARARTVKFTPTTADVVLMGGRVLTVDSKDSVAQAVAVYKDRILAVGSDQRIKRHIGRGTEVINLKGKTLTPGLIDAHAHLPYFGLRQNGTWVNLQGLFKKDEIMNRLAGRVKRTPPGGWVLAWGVESVNLWYLSRGDLDEISTRHPIVVLFTGGQWGWANTMALNKAGITRATPSPPGSRIIYSRGLLVHYPALNLVRRLIPKPSPEQAQAAIKFAAELYVKEGVTTIHDNFVFFLSPLYQRAYFDLAAKDRLPARVKIYPYLSNEAAAIATAGLIFPEFGIKRSEMETAFGRLSKQFRVQRSIVKMGLGRGLAWCRRNHRRLFDKMWGGFKLAVDGGGPTSMWYRNYRGLALHRPDDLRGMVDLFHGAGHQISVHAIGDQAVDIILACYEVALKRRPRPGHRHRIEHALSPTGEAIGNMRRLGVTVCTHPQWLWAWGHKFERLDRPRSWPEGRPIIPVKTYLDQGVPLAFGADPPAHSEYRPQYALYEAMVRKNRRGYSFGSAFGVSAGQALRVQTMGGAFISFEERDKGSVEKGKLADLAVWDIDFYTATPEKIRDSRALLTMVGGRVVHRARGW